VIKSSRVVPISLFQVVATRAAALPYLPGLLVRCIGLDYLNPSFTPFFSAQNHEHSG
jgi:hypothetical protein